MFNGLFNIVTFEQAIELLIKMNKEHPRKGRSHPVGLYIETKMYSFYLSRGFDIVDKVL